MGYTDAIHSRVLDRYSYRVGHLLGVRVVVGIWMDLASDRDDPSFRIALRIGRVQFLG